MSRLRLLCTAAVLTLAANANASSLIMTTDSIVGALKATSDATSDATSSLRDNKVWPPVGRADNVHGDRHLFCSCIPIADYA